MVTDVRNGYLSLFLFQWYPGHIARAEKALKEQLKWVDVVLEVRDARIPQATSHPEVRPRGKAPGRVPV